jgi:hypothetical protein
LICINLAASRSNTGSFPSNLILVKDRLIRITILRRNQQELIMPIDSILVSAAVLVMFVIFAGVLAWGERQSRPLEPQSTDSHRKRRSF